MNKIFISHASEDKDDIARPLALALSEKGFQVWFDEFTLTIGDNLRKNIDLGLASCDFGVIIISEYFFKKEWTQIELEGLVSMEVDFGKTILPIWHNVDKSFVLKHSPSLSNKIAVNSNDGIDAIVSQIIKAVNKKGEQLRIKKSQKNRTELFKLLNLEIEGKKLVDSILDNWVTASGITKKNINRIEIILYEDYSGIDTYDNARIVLSDGTKIKLKDKEINETVNNLIPESLENYEILYWVPIPKKYPEKPKLIGVQECNLDIIAIKANQKVTTSQEAFELIVEIIEFLRFDYEDYIAFSYDEAFEEGKYLNKLLEMVFEDDRLDLIDILIFEKAKYRRASWTIAQRFIDTLVDPITKEEKKLVKKLIKENEPLNDYWKEKLTSNFIK